MKNFISPGCGFCLYEHTCKKRLELEEKYEKEINKNDGALVIMARGKFFGACHSCESFEVDPKVGKSKSELMSNLNK